MASKETRIAHFDTEPPSFAPHEGGWYVYTNAEQQIVTDDMSGEERTIWVADAVWQKDKPVEVALAEMDHFNE